MAPVDQHLAMIKRLAPGVKRLGFLYNPGEVNSVPRWRPCARRRRRPASRAGRRGAEIERGAAAARSHERQVDAFYVPTDNTVVSAFEAVVKVGIDAQNAGICRRHRFGGTRRVAALGFNYYGSAARPAKSWRAC